MPKEKTSDIKLCKDCKYCILLPSWTEKPLADAKGATENALRFSVCARTVKNIRRVGWEAEGFDEAKSCSIERMWNWFDARISKRCGKEGRYWESK